MSNQRDTLTVYSRAVKHEESIFYKNVEPHCTATDCYAILAITATHITLSFASVKNASHGLTYSGFVNQER